MCMCVCLYVCIGVLVYVCVDVYVCTCVYVDTSCRSVCYLVLIVVTCLFCLVSLFELDVELTDDLPPSLKAPARFLDREDQT